MGIPVRAREARGLRDPPRREQRLRLRAQPRVRPARLSRRYPRRSGWAVPRRRPLRQGRLPPRLARPSRARRGLGPLPRGGPPLRRRLDARRMGRPHSAARAPRRGEPPRRGDRDGRARWRRAEGLAMTLAETQALFHAAVTGEVRAPSLEIQRCFAGSPELTASERVGIYADMYLWRLVDALREDYPKLA